MTSSRYSYLDHLDCSRCARVYDADKVNNLCECGAPLIARYDLPSLASSVSRDEIAARPVSLWRYHELLPVRDPRHAISLGEVMTPVLSLPSLGQRLRLSSLHLKDEGHLPTGTFKARGAAVGISRAKELGVGTVAMPTNGNAGAAWAAYAARAGIKAIIVMPEGSPAITKQECSMMGAQLFLVDGLIGDAGRLVADAVAELGCFDASTFKEPYRLEGKKTMGLELIEQLGWRVPDVIIYPTGGGVGLVGIHKALSELQALGWLGPKLPRLVAVQAAGCAPVVSAFEQGMTETTAWPDAHTIAFGITVPKPLADFLILDAVYRTEGCAVSVDDDAILAAQEECAETEGLLLCPEGAATIAAARQLRASGWLEEGDETVLLNTGTGIKYPMPPRSPVAVLPASSRLPL